VISEEGMMRRSSRKILVATAIVVAAIATGRYALGGSIVVAAQGADDALMKAYVLELPKVNGYLTAGEALAAARKADRALAADLEAMKEEDTETVAEARAALKARPRVLGFFQKSGLSVDDVVLIPRVLIAAGMAAEFPAAAGAASAAQIAFVKQNRPLLERFQKLNKALENDGDDN
jgi:hypothetical protein